MVTRVSRIIALLNDNSLILLYGPFSPCAGAVCNQDDEREHGGRRKYALTAASVLAFIARAR